MISQHGPADHPVAWYHEYDGGRAWYTALGHTREAYAEPAFRSHLLEHKSAKRKRAYRRLHEVASVDARHVTRLAPYLDK